MASKFNISIIIKLLGYSIILTGFLMMICILVAIVYKESTVIDVLLSSAICFVFGGFMVIYNRKTQIVDIKNTDVFAIVTLTWFVMGLFGALPFLISGAIPNFTNAYFESVSGFTTTGASILSDIESLPKSLLIWRSFTQWIGGMGILVLVIAVMSVMGIGDLKIFVAEVSGPKTTKLHPKIKNTARRLWFIYLLLTAIVFVLLILGGKNIYEATCHSFSTMASGGFSPKNTSIGDYSNYIQIVITVFMFLSAINFTLYFALFKGNFKTVFLNRELQAFFVFILIIAGFIGFYIFYYGQTFSSLGESLKHSFFQVISIISTTGFSSADYNKWPPMAQVLLLYLCFMGGMIGSTSGGLKFSRIWLLIINIRHQVMQIIYPRAVIPFKANNMVISGDIIRNFFSVFMAWVFFTVAGILIFSFFTSNLKEAVSVAAASLGAVGPALGEFGPAGNYSNMHDGGKWLFIVFMVIGRLEIISVIAFIYYLVFGIKK